MRWLLLLFVVVPLVELALLIQIGRLIGMPATLGLIVFTGLLGAYLARRQGLAVIRQVQDEIADGHMPAGPLVDGVLILIAAAVLMTPGVLTDVFGFSCLVPAFRKRLKAHLKSRLERAVQRGDATISVSFGGDAFRPPMRDVTPKGDSRIEADRGRER